MQIVIRKSTRKGKKWEARIDGRRSVHFGQASAPDYTLTGDKARKALYLARHAARENWADITTAGALSRWILWNRKTVAASVRDASRRFPGVSIKLV